MFRSGEGAGTGASPSTSRNAPSSPDPGWLGGTQPSRCAATLAAWRRHRGVSDGLRLPGRVGPSRRRRAFQHHLRGTWQGGGKGDVAGPGVHSRVRAARTSLCLREREVSGGEDDRRAPADAHIPGRMLGGGAGEPWSRGPARTAIASVVARWCCTESACKSAIDGVQIGATVTCATMAWNALCECKYCQMYPNYEPGALLCLRPERLAAVLTLPGIKITGSYQVCKLSAVGDRIVLLRRLFCLCDVEVLTKEAGMEDVYIIGVGMFRFGKYPEKSIKQMTAEVIDNLLADRRSRRRIRGGVVLHSGDSHRPAFHTRPGGAGPAWHRASRP